MTKIDMVLCRCEELKKSKSMDLYRMEIIKDDMTMVTYRCPKCKNEVIIYKS